MSNRTLPREFYVPNNSTPVEAEGCEAVAYYYTTPGGALGAAVFFGKQAKPVESVTFSDRNGAPAAWRRDTYVQALFDRRRKSERWARDRAEERKARGRGLELGDIVVSSWGYDQTQIDALQITALIGTTMVELRAIACETVPGTEGGCGPDSDRVRPVRDAFLTGRFAATYRRVAKGGYVSLDSVRGASKWDGASSYHRSSYR